MKTVFCNVIVYSKGRQMRGHTSDEL